MKWNRLPVILPNNDRGNDIWAYSKKRGVFLTPPSCVDDMPDVLAWLPGPERPHRNMEGWRRPDDLPQKTGDVCVVLQTLNQKMYGSTGWPKIVYYLAEKELFCGCGFEGPIVWRPLPTPPTEKSLKELAEEVKK